MSDDTCRRCGAAILSSVELAGISREGEAQRVITFRCINGHTVRDVRESIMPRAWWEGWQRIYHTGDEP